MTNPTRREVLAGVCGAIAAGFIGIAEATPAEAATGIKTISGGKVEVTVAKVSALSKDGGAVLLTVKGQRVGLKRLGASQYAAFNLTCTHAGGPVNPSGRYWTCPWHGATYDSKTGKPGGSRPAPAALKSVKVSFANGVVTVG